MDDLFKAIFSAPIATLLIVAGVGFLAIAVLGKIGNIFEAEKIGRIVSGTIGTTLLVIGLNIHFRTPESVPLPGLVKLSGAVTCSAEFNNTPYGAI